MIRVVMMFAAGACLATSVATAQLQDHVWVGGTGNQEWQVNSNWNPALFPNDPGRVDLDMTVISPVEGANLSVNLPANLNVDVGEGDVTIAALTIGSTSGAVATNVTTSGGRLVFENFELNDDTDPDNVICAFNCGVALITSQGVAGATNTIGAVVGVNDALDIDGTNNITLAGGVAEIGTAASLRAVSPGLTVFITGNITTFNMPPDGGMDDAPLSLNSSSVSQGTLDISGVISGDGRLSIGTGNAELPLGTVILRGNNMYTARTFNGRGNIVLAHNNALGTGILKHSGPANQVGYNFLSDNDARTISNVMEIGQWQTVKGEHSLEWAGIVYQDNARGWINMLPAGKMLTLSGGQYPNHTEENPPLPGRFLTIDGSGKTVVTGGLHDEWSDETQMANLGNFVGSFRFRGTGTVMVSGGNSTYSGNTSVEGSNLHFATNADFGNTAQIISTGGAVGVDAGVVGNDAFLNKLDAADHGGLMLGNAEYGMNLNFMAGAMANAANMSLAPHEAGSTFTGTITPANDTYRLGGGTGTLTLPNANQLTGARNVVATNGGEVHIPTTNNYTGTTSIIAKYQTSLQNAAAADTTGFDDGDNVPNDQLYVGTTISATTLANGGSPSSLGSASSGAGNLYIQGSTLKYIGAAASSDRLFTIGTGGATIDASGSGPLNLTNSGPLGIDIAEERTGNVNAFATGNTANDRSTVRNLPSTEDLQPGMPIMSPGLPLTGQSAGIPANTVITRIISATEVGISNAAGEFAFYNGTPITFGPAPERTLTLTGSNSGDNTLASVIGDASDGGVVGVTKTGDGKWILTGNNTYTGDTTVDDGILSITNAFLAEESDVRVNGTAVLDLDFTGIDVISGLFVGGVAKATGTWGAIGNTEAMFQSSFFTGTGLLEVTAAPTPVPGDYNQNGIVDAADYVLWRKNVGPGSLPNEGGISPGVVDEADYDFWRSRFGATDGAGAALGSTTVPEPASALLFGSALVGLAGMAGRRRVVLR